MSVSAMNLTSASWSNVAMSPVRLSARANAAALSGPRSVASMAAMVSQPRLRAARQVWFPAMMVRAPSSTR